MRNAITAGHELRPTSRTTLRVLLRRRTSDELGAGSGQATQLAFADLTLGPDTRDARAPSASVAGST